MKPIRIVRHEDWIEAGLLADVLSARGIPHLVTAIDQGDPVPESVDDISGLALLGCTRSVNDNDDWSRQEIALIERALAADVPVLGHCFGSQLLAKALGAEVYAMTAKEIGWHTVTRSSAPAAHEWLGDGPSQFEALIWHHDAFTLPAGATPLFGSDFCPDQAFAFGDSVATVGHLEVTAALLERWLQTYGYDLEPPSATVQNATEIRRDIEARIARMHRITNRIYERWLQGVNKQNGHTAVS